jgi:hypothetical protein
MARRFYTGKYKQGTYRPRNPEKYKGTTPIIYRSSLELKYCQICDLNEKVLSWGSESVVVPYVSPKDGKVHRYFVDFVMHLKEGSNIGKYLVEIKPDKFTRAPVATPRKKPKTLLFEKVQYAVNISKWEAAEAWAKKKGYKFVVLTEKDLKKL